MKQFDIEATKFSIIDLTKSISKVIIADADLDLDAINEISDLYDQKKTFLDNLKEFLGSEEGKIYIDNNSENHHKFVELFKTLETPNLEYITENTKIMGEKVKQAQKQKSVLIYTKENQNDDRISK